MFLATVSRCILLTKYSLTVLIILYFAYVQLVSTLGVYPEYNLLFFHPDAKVNHLSRCFSKPKTLLMHVYDRVTDSIKHILG